MKLQIFNGWQCYGQCQVFSVAHLERSQDATCATVYTTLAAGLRLQPCRIAQGPCVASRGYSVTPCLGRAGTATDLLSSLRARAGWGRIGAVCGAGVWPPSAAPAGSTNRTEPSALPSHANPASHTSSVQPRNHGFKCGSAKIH